MSFHTLSEERQIAFLLGQAQFQADKLGGLHCTGQQALGRQWQAELVPADLRRALVRDHENVGTAIAEVESAWINGYEVS